MVMFRGVKFRSHDRRQFNGKGPNPKLEAYVATYKNTKVWVQDNDSGGVSLYENDMRKPIAQQKITEWLPAFIAENRAKRRIIFKKCLSDFAAEHPDGLNTDTSTTSDKNGSDTPSVYTSAQSDLDILQLYRTDNSVPDEEAATMVGEAKARSAGMSPVPYSVVIEAKRTALDIGLNDPWVSMPYVQYVMDKTSKKRKRSETPPCENPPPISNSQLSWDRLYAMKCPRLRGLREKCQEIVDNCHTKLAEQRARSRKSFG